MADAPTLKVESRADTGKTAGKALRNEEFVPGVYYTKDENIPVKCKEVPLMKAYRQVGLSHLLKLEVEKDGSTVEKPCLIKEIIFHPTKPRITHVDFYGVGMDQIVNVRVRLVFTGKSVGVGMGGTLKVMREDVRVECKPGDIPRTIEVDTTDLKIHDSFHVEDLKLPEGVKAIYDRNFALCTVAVKGAKAKPGEEEAGEE